MKKFILAALVLGCVAGVQADDASAQNEETRKIVEAPAPEQVLEGTRGVELAPEQAPKGTRKIEAPEQASTEEA